MAEAPKEWEVFLNPVKKGKEWEVNIGEVMEKFMTEDAIDEEGRTNFTRAGLVIQGAAHTYCRKVDSLHAEVLDAVRNLADADDDDVSNGGEGDEGARARKRASRRGTDYSEIVENPHQFTLGAMKQNDDQNVEEADGPVELLPPYDPFFADLLGDERGTEITDLQTGEYVGHENDLWNFRAPFTGTQYLYPGEARSAINDEAVELDLTAEEPAHAFPDGSPEAGVEASTFHMEGSFHVDMEQNMADDFVDIPATPQEPISDTVDAPEPDRQRRSTGQAQEIDPLDAMLAKFGFAGPWTEPDPEDPEFLEQLRTMSTMTPGMPRFVGDLESGFEIIDGDWGLLCGAGVDRDAGKTAEEKAQECKETNSRIRSEIKGKMPPLLDMNDTKAKLLFDPSTHFDPNPPRIRPKIFDEPPVPMTAELFVSIIDAHHRVDDDLRVDPAAVKLYNKTVREMFGPPANFRRFMTNKAKADGKTVQEVIAEEAATGGEDPDYPHEFTGAEATIVVDQFNPVPPEAADWDVPADFGDLPDFDPGTAETLPTMEMFNILREAAESGMKRASGNYQDTDLAAEVREWRKSIAPALEREQSLPEFNMRATIHSVDETMARDEKEYSFNDLVRHRPPFERSRVFSAMLQMANEGKLRIVQPSSDIRGTEEAIDAFRLVTIQEREKVAGDEVMESGQSAAAAKRMRAPSSPRSTQSPAPKRRTKK